MPVSGFEGDAPTRSLRRRGRAARVDGDTKRHRCLHVDHELELCASDSSSVEPETVSLSRCAACRIAAPSPWGCSQFRREARKPTLESPGTISWSSSRCLPQISSPASITTPVRLPPGCRTLGTRPISAVSTVTVTSAIVFVARLFADYRRPGGSEHYVRDDEDSHDCTADEQHRVSIHRNLRNSPPQLPSIRPQEFQQLFKKFLP